MADPQNFIQVVHESAPDKPYRVPAHYLTHKTLKKGLRRVTRHDTSQSRRDRGGSTTPAEQATTEGK